MLSEVFKCILVNILLSIVCGYMQYVNVLMLVIK